MNKLKPGDRIKLFGGYDMDPRWLKDRDCYYATVLKFFDNKIEKRKGDERLSAVIEFDVRKRQGSDFYISTILTQETRVRLLYLDNLNTYA
jgi:hypothetical protein